VDQAEYTPHTDFDELHYEQLLNAGIAAARGGDIEQARPLLVKASELKPADALPWLWLSTVTEDLDEQRDFLERALAADPTNAAARRGLVMLSDKLDKTRLVEEGQGVPVQHPEEPEEAHVLQAFSCSQCGGLMEFDVRQQNAVCMSCGYVEVIEEEASTSVEASEQVLDFVLPTTRAHRWAEAQHRLACSQCGAISLLPSGQTTSECPYCGSHQLITSDETVELVDPNMIGVAHFDEQQALRRLRAWLGNGWFIPDDLKSLARTSRLRLAYYPFWTFDGALQLNWVCQVNQGTSRNPHWVARQGVETEIFDDVLVPGLRNMPARELSRIEPFRLKELVEFKPEILAGWKALTYDLPLADASLRGREKVARRLRRELYNRVLLGYHKRDLRSGGMSWSGMTYKLVLLPLWVGTYRYRGKRYRLLINGQTGKVGGEKPVDTVKVVGLILSVLATLVVFSLLAWALGLFLGFFSL
jgi:DNA-directed RNA polymerase subunit RPC12/RpoP